MGDPLDARGDVRPPRKLSSAAEVFIARRVRRDAHLRQAIEHDQRVVRAAAEGLRSGEQIHQGRISRRTGLDRPPGEVVKRFVLAAVRCGEGLLAAVVPFHAAGASRGLDRGRRQREREKDRERWTDHALVFHGPTLRNLQTTTRLLQGECAEDHGVARGEIGRNDDQPGAKRPAAPRRDGMNAHSQPTADQGLPAVRRPTNN